METIITILFLLLPVIFNFIGKKFEQSGQADKADRMRKIAKALGNDDDDDSSEETSRSSHAPEVEYDDDGQIINVPPVMSEPHPVRFTSALPVREEAPRMEMPKRAVRKKTVLPEEEQPRKMEKIDPKKLVIYSEIMKPKFTE